MLLEDENPSEKVAIALAALHVVEVHSYKQEEADAKGI